MGDPTFRDPAVLARCLPYSSSGVSQLATYNPGDGTAAGAADPASCQWPSTRTTAGALPVVASGDQATLNASTALADLPAGRYLISVTADNFKIDGQHFTVASGATRVAVTMQPYPLPLGTLRLRVFKDIAPVDGTYEADAEPGLGASSST